MNINTNPYPASVASLATSLAGELERIRFIIKTLTGWSQWYAHTETLAGLIGTATSGMPDGTEALPGWEFTADTDTGFFRSAANTIDFSAGAKRVFQMTGAASAVNYLDTENSATTAPLIIRAEGTDTNIDINIIPKGTGVVNLGGATGSRIGLQDGTAAAPSLFFTSDTDTGIFRVSANIFGIAAQGRESLRLTAQSSAVNRFQITGVNTGQAPTLEVVGSDANIGLTINTKGVGTLTLDTVGGGNMDFNNTGSTIMRLISTGLQAQATQAFIGGSVSGTPAAHGLYRQNILKGLARIDVAGGVPAINPSSDFNATSVSDDAVGRFTITWDRDFSGAGSNGTMATSGVTPSNSVAAINSLATGTTTIDTFAVDSTGGTLQDVTVTVVCAWGDQ